MCLCFDLVHCNSGNLLVSVQCIGISCRVLQIQLQSFLIQDHFSLPHAHQAMMRWISVVLISLAYNLFWSDPSKDALALKVALMAAVCDVWRNHHWAFLLILWWHYRIVVMTTIDASYSFPSCHATANLNYSNEHCISSFVIFMLHPLLCRIHHWHTIVLLVTHAWYSSGYIFSYENMFFVLIQNISSATVIKIDYPLNQSWIPIFFQCNSNNSSSDAFQQARGWCPATNSIWASQNGVTW